MTNYNFIFSNKPHHKLYRHIIFWVAFGIHFFIQNLIIGKDNEALNPRTPLDTLINISYFLPIYIISTYIFIELVIPDLLFKRRYTIFLISTAALLLFNFISCYFSGVLYEHVEWKMPYDQITFSSNKYHAIVNGGFVSVMILGIAGGIKLSKKWLQKQRENEALAQAKIASELQLLKIQIKPRFLFHSLNTVKQHILADSPRSPQLILQVADLLSYILYESDYEYALLEKELDIIKDYIALEENSSGENLPMNISVSGDVQGKFVTPLILLSTVETGFEYFLENHKNFSSKLLIEIRDNQLDLQIFYNTLNNVSIQLSELDEKFVGVRKQLSNLYTANHHFSIKPQSRKITIHLRLPLRTDKSLLKKSITANKISYENI